jgi:hypothetical protein
MCILPSVKLVLLASIVICVVCSPCLAQSPSGVIGHDGLSHSESLSSNGKTVIRIENIPWQPKISSVSLGSQCTFKILPTRLIYDAPGWFATDPAFDWRSIGMVELREDRLTGRAYAVVVKDTAGKAVHTTLVSDDSSARHGFSLFAQEVQRGHSRIAFLRSPRWSFGSIFIVVCAAIALTSLGKYLGVKLVNFHPDYRYWELDRLETSGAEIAMTIVSCLLVLAIFVINLASGIAFLICFLMLVIGILSPAVRILSNR